MNLLHPYIAFFFATVRCYAAQKKLHPGTKSLIPA
jgi:hypothetical protein